MPDQPGSGRPNLAILEVMAVLGLFLYIRVMLSETGFNAWQQPLFDAAIVSSSILFFALPVLVVLLRGIKPESLGMSFARPRYQTRVAWSALARCLPATSLFGVIGVLGASHMEWPGALLLSLGFGLAGVIFARKSIRFESLELAETDRSAYAQILFLLLAGLAMSALTATFSPLLTRIIAIMVFIGFLEELFFRGYVQSRLNHQFGRKWSYAGVRFGPGLILAGLVFGLFHPITAQAPYPWPWGLWTAVMGLVLGFVREKTGSIMAPALVHGVVVLPTAFFASP